MAQVLQYLVGTSIAVVAEPDDLIMVQSVNEGPRVRESSAFSGVGSGCRFRGNICRDQLVHDEAYFGPMCFLTPGSVIDAWMNEEIQMKKLYAKNIGTAGDTLCQRYIALANAVISFDCHHYRQTNRTTYENTKKSIDGNTTRVPVAMLIGFSLVFWILPAHRNAVFPVKY